MKKQQVKATFGNAEIRLALYSYIDEGVHVVYAPALDMFGYGEAEHVALQSFETTLNEYLAYVTQHKTLEKDLEKYGWTLNTQKGLYKAPALHELLLRDETFYEIVNNRSYRKFDRTVHLPAVA